VEVFKRGFKRGFKKRSSRVFEGVVKGAPPMKKKTAKPKARTSVKVKDLSPKKNPKAGKNAKFY
jgi:hypothetical protein